MCKLNKIEKNNWTNFNFDHLCRALMGEIDDEYDKSIDFSRIRAEPLNQIVH